jgi:SnoaL-like domain
MDHHTEALKREAIRRLVSLYCDAVARRDADAVGKLVTDDVRITIAGGPERNGRDAAVAGLQRTIGDYGFLHQKCDTGLIDIDADGTRAHARLGVMELNQAFGAETVNAIFGFYEDEYQLTDSGWRFARREFTLQFRAVLQASECQFLQALTPRFAFEA